MVRLATSIGVDLAKKVFKVKGTEADGCVVFRKSLWRPQFARFMATQAPSLVLLGTCANAQHRSLITVAFAPVGASNCSTQLRIQ